MKAKSLENITLNTDYELSVTIENIIKEGNPTSKQPIMIAFLIDESNQHVKAATWDYKLLDSLKEAQEKHNICNITVMATQYKENISIRLKSFEPTEKIKKFTEENESDEANYENSFKEYITMVSNPTYRQLLEKAFSSEFFIWPAAKSMHHAFKGGLVMHSYNVCNDSVNLANTYHGLKNTYIDYDLLITGALLHDIGKVEEYTESGNFTLVGSLLSHIILGIEKIDSLCNELNIDSKSMEIIKLKHVIASHHGKLEFGSPVVPQLLEAQIISMCDNDDSKIEAICENLEYTNIGEATENIKSLNNTKIFKI